MDKKHKHIDDFFRDKLGSYSEKPPLDAWSDMDKKLDLLVPHPVTVNPYRWLGHIGIVSVVAVLGVSVVSRLSGDGNRGPAPVSSQEVVKKVEPAAPSVSAGADVAAGAAAADLPVMNEAEAPAMPPQAGSKPAYSQEALAYGESYSENADNEYVEGVTEIKSESAGGYPSGRDNTGRGYMASHDVRGNTNAAGSAAGSGIFAAAAGSAYNANVEAGILNKAVNNADNQYFGKVAADELKRGGNVVNKPMAAASAAAAGKHKAVRPDFERWGFGVKAGFERGFDNTASQSFAVAPYVSYNVSPRIAIMTQPTVKLASAPRLNVGDVTSYTQVHDDARVTTQETFTNSEVEGVTVVYYNNARYRYTQSYDSIVKTNRTGGTYMQYELPVMLSYKINNGLSVYGGVNVVYSRLQGVTEHTYSQTMVRTADTLIRSRETPAAPPVGHVLTYGGTPYSEYKGPAYAAGGENMLRAGGVVGVTYTYSNRWLLDAMVQKTPAPASVRSGYNVNAPLSAPVVRLSVGYKLKK